jgi:hypothetical protein
MTCGPRPGRHTSCLRPAAALVTAVVLLVSGCSGGSGDGSGDKPRAGRSVSPSASPSASSTTPSSAEVAPTPPPARRGQKGERAFARYVTKVWGYTLRTNDPRPLTRLSPHGEPCRGCGDLARELRKRRTQGWAVRFPGVAVGSVKVTRAPGKAGKAGKEAVAVAKVDIPRSGSYNADGSFRNTNRAHPHATFEVLMRYTPTGYRLLSFTVS